MKHDCTILLNSLQVNPTPSLVDSASLPEPPPPHLAEPSSSSPQMGRDDLPPPPMGEDTIPISPQVSGDNLPPPPMGEEILPVSPKSVHRDSSLASPLVDGPPSGSQLVKGSSASTHGPSEQVEEKAYSRQPWSGRCD